MSRANESFEVFDKSILLITSRVACSTVVCVICLWIRIDFLHLVHTNNFSYDQSPYGDKNTKSFTWPHELIPKAFMQI